MVLRTAGKLFFVAVCVSLLPLGIAQAFSGPGAGTSGNPFLVGTCAQLEAIENNLAASYRLIRSIDCAGITLAPIGDSMTPFTGTFDGSGYTIKNITIHDNADNVGIFGDIDDATINNVSVTNSSVTGDNQTGVLAGYTFGSNLTNIRVDESVVLASASNNAGAAVGELQASALNNASATHITVTGVNNVGGLVGWVQSGGTVENSFARGHTTGTIDVGGLVGRLGGLATANNTYADGIVSSSLGGSVGGLIGRVTASATSVNNSFTTAAVVGTSDPSSTGAVFGGQFGGIRNIWFDETLAGLSNCLGTGIGSSCTAVDTTGTDAEHFYGNNTAAPLDGWDFTNTWTTQTGDLPALIALTNAGPSGGPNNNDANGDGIDDIFQANVNSVNEPFANTWTTITVPTGSGCDVQNPAWAKPTAKDSGFTQATNTMTAFTLNCASTGATVPVTIIYPKQYDTSGWVLRYYNQTTQTYSTVPGAVFGTKTVGGVVKSMVTYNVTDGGSLDSDAATNGVIVDPIAPAIPSAINLPNSAAPHTGNGAPASDGPTAIIAVLSLASMGSGLILSKGVRRSAN